MLGTKQGQRLEEAEVSWNASMRLGCGWASTGHRQEGQPWSSTDLTAEGGDSPV